MKAHLHASFNGHLAIDFGDCSDTEWEALESTIVHTYGFQRVGKAAIGLDERIHPSFERSNLTLATGWDIWSGHYLLSQCTVGDKFLRTLVFELQH